MIDAEFGAPSFYVLKVSRLPSLNITDEDLKSALERTLLETDKNNHELNYYSPTAGQTIADTSSIREAFVTGFEPVTATSIDEQALARDEDTAPIYDTYRETLSYQGNDILFDSTEVIVFLNKPLAIEEVYSAKIRFPIDGQPREYESSDFSFRSAFTETSMQASLSLKSRMLCLISKESGRIKCSGRNNGRQTGYDGSEYISAHPYQLNFVPGISKVEALAANDFDQTACAIIGLSEQPRTSEIKCWGTNWGGSLGIGDGIRTGRAKNGTLEPSLDAGAELLVVLAQDAQTLAHPIGEPALEAQSITAQPNTFCAVSTGNEVYCWGGGANKSRPTKETLKASNKDIIDIRSFDAGNNPSSCLIGTLAIDPGDPPATENVYCTDSSDSSSYVLRSINYDPSTQTIAKVSAGEGHACALIMAKDNNTIPTNNIQCWGENRFGQLGRDLDTDAVYDNPDSVVMPAISATTDSAVDMVAGAHFTCYVSLQDSKLRCVGFEYNRSLTNLPPTPDGQDHVTYVRTNYNSFDDVTPFDFGEGVKVDRVTSGGQIICADLSYQEANNPTLYATKCWGQYELNEYKYYLPSNNNSNRVTLPNYVPVMRWWLVKLAVFF